MSYLVLAYKWCVNGPINFWLRLKCKYFLNFIIEWRVAVLIWLQEIVSSWISYQNYTWKIQFCVVFLYGTASENLISACNNEKKETDNHVWMPCFFFFFFFWRSDRNPCMCLRKHMRNLSMFSLPLYTTKMIKILLWQMRWALFDVSWRPLSFFPWDFICVNGHSLENKE